MNKLTRILLVATMILAVSSGAFFVFATSNYATPAEVVAGLTGRTVESVIAEHNETDAKYNEIAANAGMQKEFIDEMALLRADEIAAKVTSGELTQEQADIILARIAARQANFSNDIDEMALLRADEIAAKVTSGELTQAQADIILARIAARQADCSDKNEYADKEDNDDIKDVKGIEEHGMNWFGQNIQVLKDNIAAKVLSGKMTQEQADQILARIAACQAKSTDGIEKDHNNKIEDQQGHSSHSMMSGLRQDIAGILHNKTNR